MHYVLLINEPESAWQAMTPAEQAETMKGWQAFTQALAAAGAMVGGNRLRPVGAATTVLVTEGRTQVLDGPYADTREQLGGYYVIDAPDLNAAIDWAARCPAAHAGAVEVRPVWEMEAPAAVA